MIFQLVTIYPQVEKVARIVKLMEGVVKVIQEREPDTLLFEVFQAEDKDEMPVIVVWEMYKDEDAQSAHRRSPALAELIHVADVEMLFRKPVMIKVLTHVTGKGLLRG